MSKRKYTEKQLIQAVKEAKSYREVARLLGFKNGASHLNKKINNLRLDTSHFEKSIKIGHTKYDNLLHVKYGKIEVIEVIPPNKDETLKVWKRAAHVYCKCDCGNYKTYPANYFAKGITLSCGCDKGYYDKISGNKSVRYTGYKEISGTYWKSIFERDKEVSITIEEAWEIYLKQNRKCALSGMDISFSKGKKYPQTASIDRIDSTKGYVKDNIQWLHKDINRIKSDLKQDYFIELCRKVSNETSI